MRGLAPSCPSWPKAGVVLDAGKAAGVGEVEGLFAAAGELKGRSSEIGTTGFVEGVFEVEETDGFAGVCITGGSLSF